MVPLSLRRPGWGQPIPAHASLVASCSPQPPWNSKQLGHPAAVLPAGSEKAARRQSSSEHSALVARYDRRTGMAAFGKNAAAVADERGSSESEPKQARANVVVRDSFASHIGPRGQVCQHPKTDVNHFPREHLFG